MSHSRLGNTFLHRTLDIDMSKVRTRRAELSVFCNDLLLLIIRIQEVHDLGDPQSLRRLINHYLSQFRQASEASGIETDIVDNAQYAIVSLLDEIVLSKPGACCDWWLDHPMQVELYGENLAGEGFYKRLDDFIRKPQLNRDLLEVFYICLCLGFEGQYRIHGGEKRREIIDNLSRLISGGSGSALSPHGRRILIKRSNMRLVPLAMVGIIMGVSLVVLFIILLIVARAHGTNLFL